LMCLFVACVPWLCALVEREEAWTQAGILCQSLASCADRIHHTYVSILSIRELIASCSIERLRTGIFAARIDFTAHSLALLSCTHRPKQHKTEHTHIHTPTHTHQHTRRALHAKMDFRRRTGFTSPPPGDPAPPEPGAVRFHNFYKRPAGDFVGEQVVPAPPASDNKGVYDDPNSPLSRLANSGHSNFGMDTNEGEEKKSAGAIPESSPLVRNGTDATDIHGKGNEKAQSPAHSSKGLSLNLGQIGLNLNGKQLRPTSTTSWPDWKRSMFSLLDADEIDEKKVGELMDDDIWVDQAIENLRVGFFKACRKGCAKVSE
jgi:hypothetical protein